mmetsp:Transcript_16909/g.14799  ORF Transcript_16909/g.14799 Transcript_16909/m.14799 type:complete len:94 (+) Transcript_16909:405-686(+)
MREYLCYPERRLYLSEGKIWLIRNFEDIWKIMEDKLFICLHFNYDSSCLVKKPFIKNTSKSEMIKILFESNIQIGFICKKSTSGKRGFMKTFF